MIKLAVFAAILIFQHSNAQPPLVSDHDKLNSQVSSWLSSVDAESVDLNEISKKYCSANLKHFFRHSIYHFLVLNMTISAVTKRKWQLICITLTQLLKEMSAGFEPNIISNILNAPPVDQVLLSDKSISRTPKSICNRPAKKNSFNVG